jgi:tetratricopeptide (TPR) repeat protein
MRKLHYIIATGTALSVLIALVGASAQTPPPAQSGKPSAAQKKPSGIEILSGAAADNLVIVSTGTTGVDKAAVRAREERDATADQTVSEGEAYFKAGNTHLAIDSYKAAIDISPADGLAYRRLAEAYTAIGKLEEASRAFHKFLVEGFGPGNGNGGVSDVADEWAEYALVLVKTGQPAEAIQRYNHAASLLDFQDSKYNGGKPFLKVLLPELAVEPTSPAQVQYTPERLQALADTVLSHEERGFGSDKEAMAHMQEAVKLYPDSAVTYYYLGEAFPSRTPEQKAAYQKAVELGDEATVAAAKERLAVFR